MLVTLTKNMTCKFLHVIILVKLIRWKAYFTKAAATAIIGGARLLTDEFANRNNG